MGGHCLRGAEAGLFRLIRGHQYHGCGVAHRDLKCGSLVAGLQPEADRLWLCQGVAQIAPGVGRPDLLRQHRLYRPRSAGGIRMTARRVTSGAWAWSCTSCSGQLPFGRHRHPQDAVAAVEVSFPTHLSISAECQDLLKRLLEPDMTLRPSIEGLVGIHG